jgi:fatty-acyl-CoA synthase
MLQQQIYNNNDSHNHHQRPSILRPPFPHMRLILIGGQLASPLQLEFVRSIFPCTRIVQTYACTEAASSLTFLDATTATTDPSSSSSSQQQQEDKDGPFSTVPTATTTFDCVGHPPSHVELAIFHKEKNPNKTSEHHDDDGDDENDDGTIIRKPYVHGVLATRGPHMMNGYWGPTSSFAPQDDFKKFTHTWFRTNDIGFRDPDGRFYLVGRVTDSIRTGGETVHATEVEKILLLHPDIAEAAVFGIPNDRLGELVCCAVIPATWTTSMNEHNQQQATSPVSLSLGNLRSWCTKYGLARYKHPRRILYMNSLPRNTSGKVVKAQLAEKFLPKWSKL